MFEFFRKSVKQILEREKMTYSQLSVKAKVTESTIKCFMCGASNSRRVAERIADALGQELVYSNGKYVLTNKKEEQIYE